MENKKMLKPEGLKKSAYQNLWDTANVVLRINS